MRAMHRFLVAAIAFVPLAAIAQPAQAPPPPNTPTNWQGVSAAITEFKRKGTTLTVRVRLHNTGANKVYVTFSYKKCYLLDANAGKKYQVLSDDTGAAIAAVNSGLDEWRDDLGPGQSALLWMKFPAPPATVKTVTLAIDNAPPFDDLAIQDAP